MPENNLSPCPFCHAVPEISSGWATKWIECSCGIRTRIFERQDELERFWNSQRGWIPIEERLPSEGGFYLVTDADGLVWVCKFHRSWIGAPSMIVAWLPLPQTYAPREALNGTPASSRQ